MTVGTTLLLGLALGLRHATDPDHVVAIGTIVTRDVRIVRAVSTGVYWGIGHAATVLAVGLIMLLFGLHLPEGLARVADLLVSAMLVVLGAVAVAARPRATDGEGPETFTRVLVSPLRPLLVGVLHGLAGSAATTLLAFSSLKDERQAVIYLGLFGLGTIVGMLFVTLLMVVSFRWLGSRGRSVPAFISRGSGVASICAGIWMAAAEHARH